MNRKKKIALATLPVLALVILGSSVASAQTGFSRTLTEEQRSAVEEAHQLRKEGSVAEARAVLKKAGLNAGLMHRFHKGRGGRDMSAAEHEAMRSQHEAIKDAIDANDYDAFVKATVGAPFMDMVTLENFATLVEAHTLHESGDKAGARALLKDLVPGDMHGKTHSFRSMHGDM